MKNPVRVDCLCIGDTIVGIGHRYRVEGVADGEEESRLLLHVLGDQRRITALLPNHLCLDVIPGKQN